MNFRPCLHKSALATRQRTCQHVNRINSENRFVLLIIGVEMRCVMWNADFRVHSNDDAVESRQFWHTAILPYQVMAFGADCFATFNLL